MSVDQIIGIPRERILEPGEWLNHARDKLDENHVAELMESFKQHGMRQPPRVYFDALRDRYVPCHGFHRLAAQLKMQLEVITAIVTSTPPTPSELKAWQYVENQSLPMKWMDRARLVISIRDENGESNVATAKRLNITSVSDIGNFENWIRCLPPRMQQALDSEKIGPSIASLLATCNDAQARDELFDQYVAGAIAREQLKGAVQKLNGGKRAYQKKSAAPGKLTLKHKSGVTIIIHGAELSAIRTALGWAGRKANAAEDIEKLGEEE